MTNIAWLPFIWYFYVETAGLSLEEIDSLFEIKYTGGKDMSWDEATRLAKEEVALGNLQNGEKTKNNLDVVHVEVSGK